MIMLRNFGGQLNHSMIIQSIKCLGQVHKGDVQSSVLVPNLFLELSDDKHYVCGASANSKTKLSFQEVIFSGGWYQPIQEHKGKEFLCDGEQCYPSVA